MGVAGNAARLLSCPAPIPETPAQYMKHAQLMQPPPPRLAAPPSPSPPTGPRAARPSLPGRGRSAPHAGAMGLPVSGFPNMNAVSLEDSTGNQIVNTVDFLMVGVPSSIFAYGVIATLGYALMMLVGF